MILMNNTILRGVTSSALLTVYLFNILCMIFSFKSTLFDYPGFSPIGIISILLFIGIIVLCTFYNNLFFFFIPFVTVAFPNIINDFFPSFMMGPLSENRVASFSFFTHIDLFLLFGIFLFKHEKPNELHGKGLFYLISFIVTICVFFILTIILTSSLDLLSLFAIGTYQIRYIFLFLLYLVQIKLSKTRIRLIVYGLSFSVLFLFIESIFFTLVGGKNTLASGTLAVNVYANIIAAILLFFTFINTKAYQFNPIYFQPIRLITIAIGFTILILNGTRIAMVSLMVAGGLYYLLTTFNFKSIIQLISRLVGYGLLFAFLILIALQFDRFKSIIIVMTDLINLDLKFNENTASLFARLFLYKVSGNMILDHWLIGIGPGRWNFLKYDFGFQQTGTILTNVLLDPHSDYLSYISQYGLFGFIMIGFILIFPAVQFLKNPKNVLSFFGIIPFTLLFSGLTNSNTLKHQVFALSGLIIFIVTQKLLHQNSFDSETIQT